MSTVLIRLEVSAPQRRIENKVFQSSDRSTLLLMQYLC